MRIPYRLIAVTLLLLLLALFVWQNLAAFTEPTDLNVFFSTTTAPLGLVMLGVVAFVTLIFLVLWLTERTSSMLEARRHMRELEGARKLADEAEASRFSTLQAFLDAELRGVRAAIADEAGRLRTEMVERHNIVTAHLGEIDDRLERGGLGVGGDGAGPPAADIVNG